MATPKTRAAASIEIPPDISKRLALKDGMVVEATVQKGHLVILKKKSRPSHTLRFAGMWAEEPRADEVFAEIRRHLDSWRAHASA